MTEEQFDKATDKIREMLLEAKGENGAFILLLYNDEAEATCETYEGDTGKLSALIRETMSAPDNRNIIIRGLYEFLKQKKQLAEALSE